MKKPAITQVKIPESNFGGERGNPKRITFHHIVGDAPAALGRFKKPGEQASATFVISSGGKVYQCVPLNRIPFSDGQWKSNTLTASIEHAGGPNTPYTEKMYQASIKLCAWLIAEYGIKDFKRHRTIVATACPGQLDVERIIKEAKKLLKGDDVYKGKTAKQHYDEKVKYIAKANKYLKLAKTYKAIVVAIKKFLGVK